MKDFRAIRRSLQWGATRLLVGAVLFVAGVWVVPHRWCARNAGAWFRGDATLQGSLARGVEGWITNTLTRANFHTSIQRFNGEWLFGTYVMSGLGFGQTALEHPTWRATNTKWIELCIQQAISKPVRAFDHEAWHDDPLSTLDTGGDHGAYLGYLNLLLGLDRLVNPSSPYATLNDRITAALVRRVQNSPTLLLQSYPDEMYPVDNCAIIGSIGLYDRATGADHHALIARWVARCRARYIDRRTGLLYQCVDPDSGTPADDPRGSGTSLGSYFLSFAASSLSADLYRAARRQLAHTLFGFGVVREYPATVPPGVGDIDSGPLVFGCSISATGFLMGDSRQQEDEAWFRRFYSTAYLFGTPYQEGKTREFVAGGPLGNAIMFAMLTAQPPTKEKP